MLRIPERGVFTLALGVLLVLHLTAIVIQLPRPLDHDEAEYLHASWLMSQGERIYRDFMEDHPPYLYLVLQTLAPDAANARDIDVYAWTLRGRLFAAVCGTWAVLAAGLTVWRITRSRAAMLVTVASLLGANWTWIRAIAEIRADAPTLALFMTGLLLLFWEDVPSWRMAWISGGGIACAIAAEVWNPKWPLEGALLGLYFLVVLTRLVRVRWRYALAAVLPSAGAGALCLGFLLPWASVRDYLFFNFILKSKNLGGLETQEWISQVFTQIGTYAFLPSRFAGAWPLFGFAVAFFWVVTAWKRQPAALRLKLGLLLALVPAAFFEVRFIYPWPHLWAQFFLMWAFVVAMVYGLVAVALRDWADRWLASNRAEEISVAFSIVVMIVAVWRLAGVGFETQPGAAAGFAIAASAVASLYPFLLVLKAVRAGSGIEPASLVAASMFVVGLTLAASDLVSRADDDVVSPSSAAWSQREMLAHRLGPNDTVWVSPHRHPVAAPDASYFWYSTPDLVPMTLARIAKDPGVTEYLPALTVRDLPVCQLARGEAPDLRLIEIGAYVRYIEGACPCAVAVLRRPDVVPTPVSYVYQVVRPGESAEVQPGSWDRMVRLRVADTCGVHPTSLGLRAIVPRKRDSRGT